MIGRSRRRGLTTPGPGAQAQPSLAIALGMFALYVLLARVDPELRYGRYVLPLTLGMLWLARRAQEERLALLSPPLSAYGAMTVAVCAWSGLGLAVTGTIYPRFFEEVLFLAAPLGAAMICASLKRDDHPWPFYVMVAILTFDYIWEIGPDTLSEALRQPGVFALDLIQSRAPTESSRAFTFGVLAIFFVIRKQHAVATLCLLLTFLAGKRIVLVGLLAALPLALLRPSLERIPWRVTVTAAAVVINAGIALALRNMGDWGIADRIQEITQQSTDALMMGRVKLFALVADRLPESPVLGVGLGRITDILIAEDAWLTNTHSDVLKHFIELGPLMFVWWIGVFYWTARRPGMLALTAFMNVLFLSDNVSIYFDVMFPFYLCFAYLGHRASEQTPTARRRRPTCADAVAEAA